MKKISKTEFKARAAEIFRLVEETGQTVLITSIGIPTLEIRRYPGAHTSLIADKAAASKEKLNGSFLRYDDPFEPTGAEWEVLED